ncbi:MAG: transporter substrate-binding protein, partial [Pseudomonadota bacterium]
MNRRSTLKLTLAGSAVALAGAWPARRARAAANPIKIGILHSLTGTMAISETALKNTALMTIEEINTRGGVLGRQLEPVVADPASNWPLFADTAKGLLTLDRV